MPDTCLKALVSNQSSQDMVSASPFRAMMIRGMEPRGRSAAQSFRQSQGAGDTLKTTATKAVRM